MNFYVCYFAKTFQPKNYLRQKKLLNREGKLKQHNDLMLQSLLFPFFSDYLNWFTNNRYLKVLTENKILSADLRGFGSTKPHQH